ncbi:MAG TPA: hypothetical protein VHZ26_16245 [Caulobacteraceae bacterium]|jgi:hypothetical protein|nr:hypothetical protein [Caulobacteraceae bacterium]
MAKVRFGSNDDLILRYVRRGRVWRPRMRGRRINWAIVVEWGLVTAAACLILCVGLLVGLDHARPDLNAESRRFADAAVNAITASANPDELTARATRDFAFANTVEYSTLSRRLKRLGPVVENRGCQGQADLAGWSQSELVTAHYACELKLQKSSAIVALSLRDDADAWKITSFYVGPPRALDRPASD